MTFQEGFKPQDDFCFRGPKPFLTMSATHPLVEAVVGDTSRGLTWSTASESCFQGPTMGLPCAFSPLCGPSLNALCLVRCPHT